MGGEGGTVPADGPAAEEGFMTRFWPFVTNCFNQRQDRRYSLYQGKQKHCFAL